MSSNFPDTNAIRSQNDLAQVVGRYVELEVAGAGRLRGCCPFHSEKTPSFYLFSHQHFKCFGCGQSGDVFDFVSKMEGVSFIEAKKRLGNGALPCPTHIPAPPTLTEAKPTRSWREVLQKSALLPFEGSKGAEYLQKRGIPPEVAKRCGVRFAGNYLGRASVLFAIRGPTGKTIAVQGRAISGDAKMTVGPRKDGLFMTPGALESRRIAIAEAPIDALSLLLLFDVSAVATCGSGNLPEWFPPLLSGKDILIATDADNAGEAYFEAWKPHFEQHGANVRRLTAPNAGKINPKTGKPVKDWNDELLLRK
ncbi:MAG: toprim domain-containing protein [Armatimonadetes bacterium]|nr:toprim domain-containing protein [Armatimonadota bacterium]